ncbi:MAG: hypothetical protein KQ78_00652 [Candidatus Izimaplasma bacterium HR2]|nr:MAG: hypothetical protein KQ78_00652 [Candidatus Izimaplasma bacterium HR2]
MKILKTELITLWDVECPKCKSEILNKNGKYRNRQRFICLDCGSSFTTYSRSVLDSTKLNEEQWETIISGIIQNNTLKKISIDTGISIISISKIRRKIFDAIYPLSKFDKVVSKFYYDPFDSTTIFIPDQKDGFIYYYQYNQSSVIAFIKYRDNIYLSKSYLTKDFNLFMSCVNYPKLQFISHKDTDDEIATQYIENLIYFLKSYRGIKKELLSKYCNFYDYKERLSAEDFSTMIIKQISSHKKKND